MTTTAIPVHILMLPNSNNAEVSARSPAAEEVDYLQSRYAYRLAKARAANASGNANVERGEEETQTSEEGAGAAVEVMCSPLEIAIANCCDHDSGPPESPSDDGSSPMEESGTSGSDSSSSDGDTDKNDGNGDEEKIRGAIAKGNEGRFAALIAQHCHSAGDRALALAVLERTMELDKVMSKKRVKKCKLGEGSTGGQLNADEKICRSDTDDTKANDMSPASEKQRKKQHVGNDCNRMANFLSAGGLKVLNQWLIEAFTPVQPPTLPQPKQHSKRKRQASSAEGKQLKPKASPTGPILLPLLSILQSIPFRMDLVVDSQINKQIRKLKKNLDKLVVSFEEGSDSESSASSSEEDDGGSGRSSANNKKKQKIRSLEDLAHPISGGMSVVQVQKDVQKLMDTWKDAAAEEKERGATGVGGVRADPPADYYGALKAKMAERFETLSRYEAGEVPKPDWLEKLEQAKPAPKAAGPSAVAAPSGKRRAAGATAATKPTPEEQKRQSEATKRMLQTQAELKAAQAARLEAKVKMEEYRKRMKEGNMLKKRKAAELEAVRKGETEQEQNQLQPQKVPKVGRTRKVTWADQKPTTGAQARPLVEVREFVRETDIYQSEEEEKRGQDSDDESDEKLEEDDYDDCDYDEETQASDSVDSDDFDSIPYNEEDANFSQEEEAGFTFATQELSKDKVPKEEGDSEDGWATHTYNL